MKPEKQLYVLITRTGWLTAREGVPVKSEQDALEKTRAARGICFSTYEASSVTLNGKTFTGQAENHSPRRYVGIDKIYTREEALEEMRSIYGHVGSVEKAFMQHPEKSVYITGLERPGEFIRLKDGEKIYDRKGAQIWPAAVAAPKIEAGRDISVMKPLHIKKAGNRPPKP
jgi:hypothetical protein